MNLSSDLFGQKIFTNTYSRLLCRTFLYALYIYIYLDVIISELEKRLQGSNLHDLDKMDCKQTCKAAHVILHNTFSKNQLRDHKLYAQPLMHPFTNYLLHR